MLAQVQAALAKHGRAALSGLGGVGKTQTAVEYAYRHSGEYDHVLWVAAQSREALVSGYSTVAGFLKLPLTDPKDQTLAVAAVQRWLGSHGRWLLILDNADDLAMAREFLPPARSGHALLTTRAGATGTLARIINVEEMEGEEGALFLLRRAKYIVDDALLETVAPADQRKAKEIVLQLGGLPLALDQAGAYLEETGCGLSGYLDLYRQHAPEFLRQRGALASNHPGLGTPPRARWFERFLGHLGFWRQPAPELLRGGLASDHPEPVASTWALSFENISKANPAAAELLNFCAFLHPDAIPEEVFREGAAELGPVLGASASDGLALNRAISEVLKYSLLRRDPNARTLEIHGLVQAVLKQGMDEATQRAWAERAVRAINRVFPDGEFPTWARCERLISQALACADLIEQWGLEFPEARRLLHRAAYYLSERGQYAKTEPLYQRALAIREKALGPDHPDVAVTLSNLASVYRDQGQYAKAEPLYQRALSIEKKALGPNHPGVATTLNNLALLYRNQGRYAEAEPLFKRALAILKRDLGLEHPDVATILGNLAALYRDQGRYVEAEPMFERALAIREKAFGPYHPDVASALNNLASLYHDQGPYTKAEPMFERALAIWEKILGPEHPQVAHSLNNLASLYNQQGRYGEAEPLFKRALSIREKALGPDHPEVAYSLNNLANLYYHQDRYAEAKPLLERAVAIQEKALGPEHPEVAMSFNTLANLYRAQGQHAQAVSLYQRALAIREKALGSEHPFVAVSLNDLAGLYRAQGRYAQAEPLLKRALSIWEKAQGPEHPDVAACLQNLATLYHKQDRYGEAEPLFRRALAIYEKVMGPDHPDVATCLEKYAVLLRAAGRSDEAVPLEARARAIRAERASETPPTTHEPTSPPAA